MPRVKGLAFRSVLRAHASLRGQDSLEQVYVRLDPQLTTTLQSLLASTWYPLDSYAALWDAIQQVTGDDPDYPRVVGHRCLEQDMKLVHKLICATVNTATVIGVTGRLFGMYYDTGSCSSVHADTRTTRVTFKGCIGFTTPMWTELCGAIEAFAEQASKTPVHLAVVHGGRSGNLTCVMDVCW